MPFFLPLSHWFGFLWATLPPENIHFTSLVWHFAIEAYAWSGLVYYFIFVFIYFKLWVVFFTCVISFISPLPSQLHRNPQLCSPQLSLPPMLSSTDFCIPLAVVLSSPSGMATWQDLPHWQVNLDRSVLIYSEPFLVPSDLGREREVKKDSSSNLFGCDSSLVWYYFGEPLSKVALESVVTEEWMFQSSLENSPQVKSYHPPPSPSPFLMNWHHALSSAITALWWILCISCLCIIIHPWIFCGLSQSYNGE